MLELTDRELMAMFWGVKIIRKDDRHETLEYRLNSSEIRQILALLQPKIAKIFKNLEELVVLQAHNHEKSKGRSVGCPRCIYERYKEQALRIRGREE